MITFINSLHYIFMKEYNILKSLPIKCITIEISHMGCLLGHKLVVGNILII